MDQNSTYYINRSSLISDTTQQDEEEDDKVRQYRDVENWCRQHIQNGSAFMFDPILFERTMKDASQQFDFPLASLNSFYRNLHTNKHVKPATFRVRNNLTSKHLPAYRRGDKSIKEIAQEANFPPYFMCRAIVENVADLRGRGKKALINAMRDPLGEFGSLDVIRPEYLETEGRHQLETQHPHEKPRDSHDEHSNESRPDSGSHTLSTTRLALEVKEAIDSDPMYGPMEDKKRHLIGIEYEVVLESILKEIDIPFESEAQLRERGSSKTPDVLLSCPIAVEVGSDWKMVCWIDSKALFGDVDTHKTSVLPQAESYVHRFGPGMILYWFGHAPISLLGDARGDLVIAGWDFPSTFMWPTGEIGNYHPQHRP